MTPVRKAEKRKARVPHRTRETSNRVPMHVIQTFRPEVPQPHWRKVQPIVRRCLRVTQERYGITVAHAALMPGHAHLVIEVPADARPLGDAMRFLSSKIALELKETFGTRGPIYQDRYWSRVLGSLSEAVRVIRYVALNPVKARLCRQPADWAGSSVRDYLDGTLATSPWRFRGWMFRTLGFFDDPRRALLAILNGERRPVVARGGRQQKLPFEKGLSLPRVSRRRISF